MSKSPVVLIVLDGVGYNESPKGNAVLAANTPNLDSYYKKYPWTLLDASGEAVGLPAGFQGSSEVGHLSMGAGRIIEQELKRINDKLEDGSLFTNEKWQNLIDTWKKNNSQFHFFGLLQDEGVHAHQDHLFKLMARARQEFPEGKIVIHPFLDGRDTPPRSTLEYFYTLRNEMDKIGNCQIGTIMGRYYGMDRVKSWDLTDQAYHCIVDAIGNKTTEPETAIKESYENDKTPSGVDMFDEYIEPHVIDGYLGVNDGDVILHTNYRQDRAIQLTRAFVESDYPGKLNRKPQVVYVGLSRYYDEFEDYLLGGMDEGGGNLDNIVGQVISEAGLKQLRLAETQKFRHVTSFFNGKSTTPFANEDQVEIPGRFDPSSFAEHPEMEAYRVTDELLKRIENNPYDFILINYANGDMVGHTGDFNAAKKAVEILDKNLDKIIPHLLELDAKILLTADHGNCDQMIDYETGQVRTSHSLNPVRCVYISADTGGITLKQNGILPDIGPTVLHLMGFEIPKNMTAECLLPFLSNEEIKEGVHKSIEKYKNLNFHERYTMYMGVSQLLELELKNLLVEKYNYDFDKIEKWTLGKMANKLRKNNLREDFIDILKSVIEYRNYIAHEILVNKALWNELVGEKMPKDHYDKESRRLDKAIYELEQLFFLFNWTNSNDGWG